MRKHTALCVTIWLLTCVLVASCGVTTTPASLEVSVSPTLLLYPCQENGPFPLTVGQVRITNNADRAVAWEALPASFLYARPIEGELAPGESVTVTINTAACVDSTDLSVEVRPLAPQPFEEFTPGLAVITAKHSPLVEPVNQIVSYFPSQEENPLLYMLATEILNETLSSLTGGEERIPQPMQDLRALRTSKVELASELLDQLFGDTDFPCGPGDNGYTMCPNISAVMQEGEYLLVFAAYGDDIPLDDSERLYQYAVVFDADGDTSNNYVPAPEFENDFFRDSDLWYEAGYSPSGGWTLVVTDARDNNFTEIASAARVIISENAFVLCVPASEFSVAKPAYRVTAFCHEGDFGMNPGSFWSADLEPPVNEGLAPFDP